MLIRHVPILVGPIVEALTEPLRPGGKFASSGEDAEGYLLDCTLGGGGHTAALLEALAATGCPVRVLAIDQDARAIERATERFSRELEQGRLELCHARISELEVVLEGKRVLGLLADLGFSSD